MSFRVVDYYYVVGVNAAGAGSPSSTVSATTRPTQIVLQVAYGLSAGLPTLQTGELALATDTLVLWIGTPAGNKQVATVH